MARKIIMLNPIPISHRFQGWGSIFVEGLQSGMACHHFHHMHIGTKSDPWWQGVKSFAISATVSLSAYFWPVMVFSVTCMSVKWNFTGAVQKLLKHGAHKVQMNRGYKFLTLSDIRSEKCTRQGLWTTCEIVHYWLVWNGMEKLGLTQAGYMWIWAGKTMWNQVKPKEVIL